MPRALKVAYRGFISMSIWGKRIGLLIVFLWFFGGGITHFTNTPFFVHITPPYVPQPLAVVYISGMLEILGAIGILIPRFRQVAGTCLFLLTIVVTPANIYMLQHPEVFPGVSREALTLRLVVQVMLLLCIWTSTRNPKIPTTSGVARHA